MEHGARDLAWSTVIRVPFACNRGRGRLCQWRLIDKGGAVSVLRFGLLILYLHSRGFRSAS